MSVGTVRGRVWCDSNGDGRPAREAGLRGAIVALGADRSSVEYQAFAIAGPDGRYVFARQKPGRYQVVVLAPGTGWALTRPGLGSDVAADGTSRPVPGQASGSGFGVGAAASGQASGSGFGVAAAASGQASGRASGSGFGVAAASGQASGSGFDEVEAASGSSEPFDLAAGQTHTVNAGFVWTGPASGSGGSLPRTGASGLAALAVGSALLALGVLLIRVTPSYARGTLARHARKRRSH